MADALRETPKPKRAHLSVEVTRNGYTLVTIESNCLSGKPEFTHDDAQYIRDCARHLLVFIGEPKTEGHD